MRNLAKSEWSAHGVIVTLYEESSTIKSCPQKSKTKDSKKTIRSGVGYDRRAALLAYAHALRNVDSQQDHQDYNTPTDSYQPKPKKRRRWFGRLKALKFSFGRLFGRVKKKDWKYENNEASGGEKILRSCTYRCRERNRWSSISKKLRHVLKQFSCGCKCGKRYKHNDEHLQDLNRQ